MGFAAGATGKIPIRKAEKQTIDYLIQSVEDHPVSSKILAAKGDNELAVFHDLCGVWCKGLIDKVATLKGGRQALIDWKTTGCQSEQEFKDSIYRFGYDVQGAFYINLYQCVTGEWLPFYWVCVSKRTYETWVLKLSHDQYTTGKRWYEDMLTVYERSLHAKSE